MEQGGRFVFQAPHLHYPLGSDESFYANPTQNPNAEWALFNSNNELVTPLEFVGVVPETISIKGEPFMGAAAVATFPVLDYKRLGLTEGDLQRIQEESQREEDARRGRTKETPITVAQLRASQRMLASNEEYERSRNVPSGRPQVIVSRPPPSQPQSRRPLYTPPQPKELTQAQVNEKARLTELITGNLPGSQRAITLLNSYGRLTPDAVKELRTLEKQANAVVEAKRKFAEDQAAAEAAEAQRILDEQAAKEAAEEAAEEARRVAQRKFDARREAEIQAREQEAARRQASTKIMFSGEGILRTNYNLLKRTSGPDFNVTYTLLENGTGTITAKDDNTYNIKTTTASWATQLVFDDGKQQQSIEFVGQPFVPPTPASIAAANARRQAAIDEAAAEEEARRVAEVKEARRKQIARLALAGPLARISAQQTAASGETTERVPAPPGFAALMKQQEQKLKADVEASKKGMRQAAAEEASRQAAAEAQRIADIEARQESIIKLPAAAAPAPAPAPAPGTTRPIRSGLSALRVASSGWNSWRKPADKPAGTGGKRKTKSKKTKKNQTRRQRRTRKTDL